MTVADFSPKETGKVEAQIDPKNNHNSNSGSTETQGRYLPLYHVNHRIDLAF